MKSSNYIGLHTYEYIDACAHTYTLYSYIHKTDLVRPSWLLRSPTSTNAISNSTSTKASSISSLERLLSLFCFLSLGGYPSNIVGHLVDDRTIISAAFPLCLLSHIHIFLHCFILIVFNFDHLILHFLFCFRNVCFSHKW